MLRPRYSFLAVASAMLGFLPVSAWAQSVVSSNWLGDGSMSFNNGLWSNASLWSPSGVPNNDSGTVYDVTVPQDPNGNQFNGPELDINITVRNLTLVNRAFLDNQFYPGTSITVTGTTSLTTAPEHDGEYAAIFATGVFTLGTLSNYNAATRTLEGGFYFPLNGGTIQFHGADIVTNNSTLIVGDNSHFLNQDNGADAYVNLAVNNGTFNLGGGHDFTTAGDFTNNADLTVGNSTNDLSSSFTVGGALTNYDPDTHTLSNGGFNVGNNASGGTVTLRFAGADIQTISNAQVQVSGEGAAITDLEGNDGLRNLGRIENGSFTAGVSQTYTPGGVAGSAFTVSNSTHTILSGTTSTVLGDYNVTNGSTASINGPGETAGTALIVSGSSLVDNYSTVHLGGVPGAGEDSSTRLQVNNGLEFRNATLTGSGTIVANTSFTQGATLAPGETDARESFRSAAPASIVTGAAGQLTFVGALTLQPGTYINIKIGGLGSGYDYDQVVQTGSMLTTLGGALQVNFINGFESSVAQGDTFDIVHSDNTLSGAFDNIASGARLSTADGYGSFLVTYDGSDVILSDFQPVPEPATWLGGGATALLAAVGVLRRCRRRA